MAEEKQSGLMKKKVKRIHFVGIGGIGMSGIAEVLLNLGYEISGSDAQNSDTTERLKNLGAAVAIGHDTKNVRNADVLVTSTAVKENNPEVVEAHRKNIPVIPRAEMLAELLKMKFSVAVSGSHGKTTTTSMISTALAKGGLDPTMVIGGKLASIGSNARLGGGDIIVAEADESDGSFLKLSPTIAIITNIDREHLDYYAGIEEIKDAFLKFANIVPFYGSTVLCADNEHVREILPLIKRKFVTYGIKYPADYMARDIKFSTHKTTYNLVFKTEKVTAMELKVPGMFNVYNSLAAAAVCRELDLNWAIIEEGLKEFTGVQRRLVAVKNETAMLTTFNEVDMKPIMDLRAKYKDKFKEKYGVGLGFMSFFTKAVCQALKEWPAVNAQIDGDEIIYHDYCDISIAVSTPRGLVVPVIRNAESMTFDQIEAEVARLAARGREGKLSIEEMTGGTFSITNGGVFGSMLSTPIINPPQSAILGMHNIVERPVVKNGQIVITPVMYVAMSYDHRIIDGRESVSFLYRVKEMLEDPGRLILGV